MLVLNFLKAIFFQKKALTLALVVQFCVLFSFSESLPIRFMHESLAGETSLPGSEKEANRNLSDDEELRLARSSRQKSSVARRYRQIIVIWRNYQKLLFCKSTPVHKSLAAMANRFFPTQPEIFRNLPLIIWDY